MCVNLYNGAGNEVYEALLTYEHGFYPDLIALFAYQCFGHSTFSLLLNQSFFNACLLEKLGKMNVEAYFQKIYLWFLESLGIIDMNVSAKKWQIMWFCEY